MTYGSPLYRTLGWGDATAAPVNTGGKVNQDSSKRVRAALMTVTTISEDNLIRREAWGAFNFENKIAQIGEIFHIFRLLEPLPLETLSNDTSNYLVSGVEDAANMIQRINNFDVLDNATARRQEVDSSMDGVVDRLRTAAEKVVPYLTLVEGGLTRQVAAATHELDTAKAGLAAFTEVSSQRLVEVDSRLSEVNGLLEAARERNELEGVAKFARIFSRDKVDQEREARTWLRWSIVFMVLTIAFPLATWFFEPPTETPRLVQFISTKVIVFALLLGITTWCASNYKSCRHLATVSRFKANALSTFLTFVRSTDDKATREQILLETTRSIFAQPQTGYLRGESPSEQPSRLVEVFKSVTDQAGS